MFGRKRRSLLKEELDGVRSELFALDRCKHLLEDNIARIDLLELTEVEKEAELLMATTSLSRVENNIEVLRLKEKKLEAALK